MATSVSKKNKNFALFLGLVAVFFLSLYILGVGTNFNTKVSANKRKVYPKLTIPPQIIYPTTKPTTKYTPWPDGTPEIEIPPYRN